MTHYLPERPLVGELVVELEGQVEDAQHDVRNGKVGDEDVGDGVQLFVPGDDDDHHQVSEEAHEHDDGVEDDDDHLPVSLLEDVPVGLLHAARQVAEHRQLQLELLVRHVARLQAQQERHFFQIHGLGVGSLHLLVSVQLVQWCEQLQQCTTTTCQIRSNHSLTSVAEKLFNSHGFILHSTT